MDLKELKYTEANKNTQVVLFNDNGDIIESDDTLIKVSGTDFNLFSDTIFCGMEDALEDLEENESLVFDCINTDFEGKNSHYDFRLVKLERGQLGLIVHDYGKQYRKIFELQQERNLAEIQAKKAERDASKWKEEKDAIEKLYNELIKNDSSEYILVKSDSLLINLDMKDILFLKLMEITSKYIPQIKCM